MGYAQNSSGAESVTELAIVDTFTKLIFGESNDFSEQELQIVEAFRATDVNVMRDSYQEMGEYLRSMGVGEMIQLVSRLREHFQVGVEVATSNQSGSKPTPSSAGAARHGQNRGAH